MTQLFDVLFFYNHLNLVIWNKRFFLSTPTVEFYFRLIFSCQIREALFSTEPHLLIHLPATTKLTILGIWALKKQQYWECGQSFSWVRSVFNLSCWKLIDVDTAQKKKGKKSKWIETHRPFPMAKNLILHAELITETSVRVKYPLVWWVEQNTSIGMSTASFLIEAARSKNKIISIIIIINLSLMSLTALYTLYSHLANLE